MCLDAVGNYLASFKLPRKVDVVFIFPEASDGHESLDTLYASNATRAQ